MIHNKELLKAYLKASLVQGTDPLGNKVPGQRQALLKVVDKKTVAGELPDAVDDLVDGIAEGLSQYLRDWQAQQTVFVPGITSGPSSTIGTLPPI